MSLSENLYNLGALLKTNLEYKGITGLTGNEGLTTLANKILDISCEKEEEDPLILTVTGDSFTLGSQIAYSGQVIIDWGDCTVETGVNPNSRSHTYTDGESNHMIVVTGEITSLGERCFMDYTSLSSVVIPNSVTSLGRQCFWGCSNLSTVVIPDSVVSLGYGCFTLCSSLSSVVIPDSVTSLGNFCFSHCSSLSSVVIPNNLTNLGYGCFENCSNLSSVVIPNSITSIEDRCFRYCTSLVDYELYWESSPITYDSDKMPNNTNTIFHIPAGTKTEYINKGYPANKLVERGVNLHISIVDENKNEIEPIVTKGQEYYVRIQLLNEGFPIPNQPVTFRAYVDNIEGEYDNSATYATDSNGIIDIEMTGDGIGVITYEASYKFYNRLLQETFVVWDTIKYDNATTSDHTDIWTKGNGSDNAKLERKTEYTEFSEIVTGTDCILYTQITHECTIEFDIQIVSTDYSRQWGALGQSANANTRSSLFIPLSKRDGDWHHVTIVFTNGTGTFQIDNETPTILNVNNYDSSMNMYFRFLTGNEITGINFKNFKVYSA